MTLEMTDKESNGISVCYFCGSIHNWIEKGCECICQEIKKEDIYLASTGFKVHKLCNRRIKED
jgi:hypothetical protein